MIDEPLWIGGCPYCEIFTHGKYNGKLIYPENKADLKSVETAIIDNGKDVIIVYRDHIPSIAREPWGRLLYRVRQYYGSGVKLKVDLKVLDEHFYCTLIKR